MKRLPLLLLFTFLLHAAHSQNVTAAEYFFDTDPGPGNGNAITISSPGDIVNFTATPSTVSLGAGFHFIAIRVKDVNGKWGLFESRGFYVSNSTADAPNIINAEYFIDADPGAGNGIPASVGTIGAIVNFTAVIPTSVGAGFHFLAIRVKDANGKWGLFETRGFYVSSNTADASNIGSAEYFIDTDPGPGNGSPTSVGSSGSVVNFTATIPTVLSTGFHVVAIRTKGLDGKWGLFEARGFYVSSSAADASNIGAAEYFIDTDPGPGNGTPTSVGSSGSVVNFTATIPTALSAGFHFVAIRTKGLDGKWGLFEIRGFYVSASTGNMPIITSAEYFFDADPGIAAATPLTITLPGDVVTQTFSVPAGSLGQGQHFLGIRVKDQSGNWGLYDYDTLTIGNSTISCPSNVVVSAGAGQCTAVVNNIDPTITPSQPFTYTLTGATTGNGSGTASGQTFNSGVTTVTYTLTGSPSVNCSFTVTVNSSVVPSVTIGASATSICAGTNVTFTATPNNGGTPFYQWKLNDGNVGTNSATYQNSSLANNDVVKVVMTSSISCANPASATSNSITMTVSSNVTPTVTIGASATTICAGTNVTFTATPNGGGTPSYQWKLNGGNVGTNSATYQNSTLANNDVVTVVMTSSLACANPTTATSNAITMTVNPSVTPSVTIGASATNICSGTNVTFTATPNLGGTPIYQWKLNGGNAGTNSATYQNSSLVNNDVVTVVMTSSISCANPASVGSNAITMTVNTTVVPTVTIGASATTICAGTNVTFTATPNNGGSPSYQWKLNGGNAGTNSATYQNASLANNDVVTVVMTSTATCASPTTANSNAITITVSSTVVPTVNIGASATTICAGTNVIFTATPNNGGAPSYQWKLNGGNVGTNSATYQNSSLANNDIVSVVMTSTLACASPTTATSNALTMTVNATVIPSVNIGASATAICAGTNVTFTATPNNGGTPSYQWKLNGGNVGTNTATYQNAALSNNDVITVVMTSTATCASPTTATSNAITITLNSAPAITTPPSSQTVFAGSNVTFNVTATGAGLTYQWRKASVNISAATASSYTINNVAVSDGGNYDVVVTGTCSPQATSAVALLTVNPFTITTQPASQSVCAGANVTFTIVVGGTGLTYQWQLSTGGGPFNNITGATNTSLALSAVTVLMSGNQYRCVINGSVNSNAATLTVFPLPVVSLVLPFDTLYQNSPPQILSGGSPTGGVFSGSLGNITSFDPAALLALNYNVIYTYTDSHGCIGSANDIFTVIPRAYWVRLYPNPAKDGDVTIVVAPDLLGGKATAYNELGEKVEEWIISGRLETHHFKWAAGTYWIDFKSKYTQQTQGLVIYR